MKALANSPDASTDFFNDSFVTKNEDHDFLEDTEDKNTYEGKRSLSNFDYLFEERDWLKDVDEKGKESVTGRDFMAQALESATTGHPAGEQPAKGLAPHNAEQADLMENIVASITEDGERLNETRPHVRQYGPDRSRIPA
ncbi:hypothetical protein ABCR94_38815 [Streptomyces sp. 21So2-11]|uniref:hypothetical protein n=1 Tax=Streptomyces sp. 21So2-11 TaxID=3144408 RepID=UPI00321BD53F